MNSKYIYPDEYKELFNIDRILSNTSGQEKLHVILKKDELKGTGLFAQKYIEKGKTIAYYKFRTFNRTTYESPTNFVYTFNVYLPTGKESKHLIGDINLDSFPDPINNIPFWAPFVNEPSGIQDINAEIDTNVDFNYKNGRKAKCNRVMIYKLISKRAIMPGEEITIYYGDLYDRTYDIDPRNCHL